MNPWTFVHAADIQVGSPRSFRFAPAWNENWQTARKQIIEINPDLLLIGGDLTRDGSIHRYEMEAIKADLDSLPFPCHVIPGNMDTGNKHTDVNGPIEGRDDVSLNLTSEQLRQFSSVFGPLWWSFVHKDVRFSGFCDMLAGSGLPEEKWLWDWIEALTNEPRARHHVWIMHHALFIDEPDEPSFDIRERYLDWYFGVDEPSRSRIMRVFKDTGAEIIISGHIHCRRVKHVDGIRFDYAPATSFYQWGDRWPDGDQTLGFDVEFEARFYPKIGEYISAVASMGGGLMVEILKLQVQNPLKYYHEKMIESMQEQLGHFKGTETSKMRVADMDAYYTSFEYRSWNGLMGRNMKGIVVSLWDGENHLALKMIAPAEDYDKMFDAFGGFLKSFKTERMPE